MQVGNQARVGMGAANLSPGCGATWNLRTSRGFFQVEATVTIWIINPSPMKTASLRALTATLIALAFGNTALADRIELTDGSVINGKLVSAEGGKFKVDTAFAGTIDIAQ